MTDKNDRRRYRINAVSEQTGVPEATLRAWERRYQVPKPLRTPSGYRLYSQQDVAQVQQIRALCEGGMSPADAAREVAMRRQEAKAHPGPESQESATQSQPTLGFLEELQFEARNPAGIASLSDIVRVMDKASVIAASRHAGRHTVVMGMADLIVEVAVRKGQLLALSAEVVSAGPLSVTVEVSCHVEHLAPTEREHVGTTRFTLIALDAVAPPLRG